MENFIAYDKDLILDKLSRLKSDSEPKWGTMSAHQMIEHLSDTFLIAIDELSVIQEIEEEKIERAQQFIPSRHPLPKNFKVKFSNEGLDFRNSSITEAINELAEKIDAFENYFINSPENHVTLHPNFGMLNYEQWKQLSRKHFQHHFEQFDLI